jgi:hypothetical protein
VFDEEWQVGGIAVSILDLESRNILERIVLRAREVAEDGARKALQIMGIGSEQQYGKNSGEAADLRRQLKVVMKRLGGYRQLTEACAYWYWHRMLFARFLAENGLLIHPDYKAPVTLDECAEIAHSEGDLDRWGIAARFASDMLPGIFPKEDPLMQVRFTAEDRVDLERLLEELPPSVFTSSDGLGWTYQFWQKKRKSEVQSLDLPVEGADIAALTQLFTEPYMVRFLLQNTLGAWWTNLHPENPLEKKWAYHKSHVEHDFSAWPKSASEVKIIDPCCGSGHFLVEAFEMLLTMRREEGQSLEEAIAGILTDNLYALELDARCVQIAAFSLALTAWKCGYPVDKDLPIPNIACCGLPLGGDVEEWRALANGDPVLADAMVELHEVFSNASELGSLIDPGKVGLGGMFAVNGDELTARVEQALTREKNIADPVAEVFGGFAKGALRAFSLLKGEYHLAVTNPPFLKRQMHGNVLRDYCDKHHPAAIWNIATSFIERCGTFTLPGGYYALVNPQNWLSSPTDEAFRKRLITEQILLWVACLGPRAFEAISGEVVQVALMGVVNATPKPEFMVAGLDVSDYRTPLEKSKILAEDDMGHFSQLAQLSNPASRILIDELKNGAPLKHYVESGEGSSTGDKPRYVRKFWELRTLSIEWATYAASDSKDRPWGGREHVLFWENGRGELAHSAKARIQNRPLWSKAGVLVGRIGRPSVTLYRGGPFDKSCVAICPISDSLLPAIWLFCRSTEYKQMLKMLDRNLAIATSALTEVPFDVKRWQAEADKAGPIPEPYSEDPTQWFFKGNILGSNSPLHVAVCRLLGYRWPEQPEEDELFEFIASDGIVCIPPILGQRSTVDRLRDLLAAVYGAEWNMAVEDDLLEQVGYREKGLEAWLRDGFFSQHSRLFHNRPFIWHIWDGSSDGFSVLANYHMLDRPKLEKLIYSYLGDWISRQKESVDIGTPGAEQRLRAAETLKSKLELILVGEGPYDIYVRWKSIAEQTIGWNPDLNDGVRLNIRPFVMADVLRRKVTVSWGRDSGRNLDGSERINHRHLTLKKKQNARKALK